MLIAPSLLAADFANLQRDIEMVNESQADWFHLDIMDGLFVPNISYGMPVVKAIKEHAKKPLDVHLTLIVIFILLPSWEAAFFRYITKLVLTYTVRCKLSDRKG